MMTYSNHTPRRAARLATLSLVAGATGAALMAGPASAHHPDIAATAACVSSPAGTGRALVTATATPWAGWDTASMSNPAIRLSTGNETIATGAFTGQGSSVKGSLTRDGDGTTITITATADGPWGNGAPAGDSRTITITLPVCARPLNVEPVLPSLPPQLDPTPTPAVPVEIGTQVLSREVVAAPVVEQPAELARTGLNPDSTVRFLMGGLASVIFGGGMLAWSKRGAR